MRERGFLMKRLTAVLLGTILGVSTLMGGAATVAAEEKQEEKHIVFVTPLVAHPVWLAAKDGLDAAAEDLGFRGEWVGPSSIDVDEMIKQIEVAIAEKADGIITQGLNPEAMVPVLKKADEAGIPVVVVNSDIPDAPRLAYIGTEPVNLGSEGAKAIIEKMDGETIKAAYGVTTFTNTISMNMVEGYKETFEEAGNYEEQTVIETMGDTLTAVQKWQDVLNTYPETNVIIGTSAETGAAAAKVVNEMGLEDQVVILAIDDIEETLDGIRNGSIYGTMTQNFYRKGYQACQYLMDFIENGTVPEEMINDSGTTLVTLENIDTYNTDMKNPESWK